MGTREIVVGSPFSVTHASRAWVGSQLCFGGPRLGSANKVVRFCLLAGPSRVQASSQSYPSSARHMLGLWSYVIGMPIPSYLRRFCET